MITVSVRCALRTAGSRNARTPLLTASTPVIAVQPLENTWSSNHRLAAAAAGAAGGGATTAVGWPPEATARATPMTMLMSSVPRKRYVGTMKNVPASRTPRKFTSVTTRRMSRQSSRVWGCSRGTAETSAPTPAAMPTAATST